MSKPRPRRVALIKVPIGARVKLADGRPAVITARIRGDVFVREVTGERWEWAPGKYAAREGEMEIQKGTQEVEHG